jgi:hypothetical protein
MSNEYDNIDIAILDTIDEVRTEHHACSLREVARRLRASPDVIRYRCQLMRELGKLTWTDVTGSLRVLGGKKDEAPSDCEQSSASSETDQPSDSEAAEHYPVGEELLSKVVAKSKRR